MNKAVFLDRDGVINELVYYEDHEIIDSPFTAGQLRIIQGVPEAINLLHRAGYLVILVSNQPGIAKGYMSFDNFEKIRRKMNAELGKAGVELDGEYYCLHHPEAIVGQLKVMCECRKPKPGLIFQAAREKNVDLQRSWFVGDNLTDIQAGKNAGCWTILLGKMKCELCRLMEEKEIRPDNISVNLAEAVRRHILNTEYSTNELAINRSEL
jgi:D,D-heptose 1,7-bisphosphate phosphatase